MVLSSFHCVRKKHSKDQKDGWQAVWQIPFRSAGELKLHFWYAVALFAAVLASSARNLAQRLRKFPRPAPTRRATQRNWPGKDLFGSAPVLLDYSERSPCAQRVITAIGANKGTHV
jgi:hypothetical protein